MTFQRHLSGRDNLGSASVGSFIPMPAHAGGAGGFLSTARAIGVDRQGGSHETLPVHNFSNEASDTARLVRAAVNGVVGDFLYIPFVHSSTDSHSEQ